MTSLSLARLSRLAILSSVASMVVLTETIATASPISLDVLQRDGYGTVDLIKGIQNKLYVAAEINGKKVRLLLDTGWGSEGITIGMNPSEFNIVPEKGVKVSLTANGGHAPVGHGTAQSVLMGNVRILGTPIYFGHFTQTGFIGRGFLKRNNAVIDSANLRLYLRPPGKGRSVNLAPALGALGLASAPFFDVGGNLVINVEVNGVPTQMALDTGAEFTELDTRFAKVASAKGWGRNNVRSMDAVGIQNTADFAGTESFKIAGIPIRTPTVFISRFAGYDHTHGKLTGLLGLDVIGLNWGIIDVGQQKFYFTRAN